MKLIATSFNISSHPMKLIVAILILDVNQ